MKEEVYSKAFKISNRIEREITFLKDIDSCKVIGFDEDYSKEGGLFSIGLNNEQELFNEIKPYIKKCIKEDLDKLLNELQELRNDMYE